MGTQGAYPRVQDGWMGLAIAYVQNEGPDFFCILTFYLIHSPMNMQIQKKVTDSFHLVCMKSRKITLNLFVALG